jgi:hypothetical protein
MANARFLLAFLPTLVGCATTSSSDVGQVREVAPGTYAIAVASNASLKKTLFQSHEGTDEAVSGGAVLSRQRTETRNHAWRRQGHNLPVRREDYARGVTRSRPTPRLQHHSYPCPAQLPCGDRTIPPATISSTKVPPGVPEYMIVTPGLKLAAIRTTTSGTLHVTECSG